MNKQIAEHTAHDALSMASSSNQTKPQHATIAEWWADKQRKPMTREEAIDALLKALRLVQVDCQYLHHAKKDQHDLGQPCPVVDRVNAAIKAAEENT